MWRRAQIQPSCVLPLVILITVTCGMIGCGGGDEQEFGPTAGFGKPAGGFGDSSSPAEVDTGAPADDPAEKPSNKAARNQPPAVSSAAILRELPDEIRTRLQARGRILPDLMDTEWLVARHPGENGNGRGPIASERFEPTLDIVDPRPYVSATKRTTARPTNRTGAATAPAGLAPHRDSDDPLARFHGMQDRITAVAWGPDHGWVAAGSESGQLRIWPRVSLTGLDHFAQLKQAAIESDLPSVTAHDGAIRSILVINDGQQLLTAGDDGMVRIWNTALESPQPAEALPTMARQYSESASGRYAMVLGNANEDGYLIDRNERTSYQLETPHVLRTAFDPAEQLFVVAYRAAAESTEITIELRSLPERKTLLTLQLAGTELSGLAVSSSARRLFASQPTKGIHEWQLPELNSSPSSPVAAEAMTTIKEGSLELLAFIAPTTGEPGDSSGGSPAPDSDDGTGDESRQDNQTQPDTSPADVSTPSAVDETVAESNPAQPTDQEPAEYRLLVWNADEGAIQLYDPRATLKGELQGSGISRDQLHFDPVTRTLIGLEPTLIRDQPEAQPANPKTGKGLSPGIRKVQPNPSTEATESAPREVPGSIVRIWDAQELTPLAQLTVTDTQQSAAVGPNGSTIILGADTGMTRVVRLKDGVTLQVDPGSSQSTTILPTRGDRIRRLVDGTTVESSALQVQRVIPIASASITACRMTPDATRLVIGDAAGAVQVIELATGNRLRESVREATAPVLDLALSPDGATIAAAYYGKEVCLWSLDEQNEKPETAAAAEKNQPGLGIQVKPRANAKPGETVLEGRNDDPLQRFEHRASVWGVDFDETGQLIAGAGEDNTVVIWNRETGRVEDRFSGHKDAVVGVWMLNVDQLLSLEASGIVRVWNRNRNSGQDLVSILPREVVLTPVPKPVSGTGNGLASGGVSSVSTTEDPEVARLLRETSGVDERARIRSQFSTTSGTETTPSVNDEKPPLAGEFRFDDLAESEASPESFHLDVSMFGEMVAAAITWPGAQRNTSSRRSLRIWDTATRSELRRWDDLDAPVSNTIFPGTIPYLWSIGTGQQITRFDLVSGSFEPLEFRIESHAVSPDGSRVVVGIRGVEGVAQPVLVLIDLQTLKPLAELSAFEATVPAVAFIPESDWIVASIRERNQNRLVLLDSSTLEEREVVDQISLDQPWLTSSANKIAMPGITDLAVSSNGRVLITYGQLAGSEYRFTVWGRSSSSFQKRRREQRDQELKLNRPMLEEFDDGRPRIVFVNPATLVAILKPTGIDVVNLTNNDVTLSLPLEKRKQDWPAIAFSPSGEFLVAGTENGELAAWNMKLDRQPRRFVAHLGPVLAVKFSPDGTSLATLGEEGSIKVWSISDWLPR